MDWYHEISKDNNVLKSELIKAIKEDGIKPLGDWRAIYYKGYDGYLVNMAYNILNDTKIYDKGCLASDLYETLKPIYDVVGNTTKKDFEDIIGNIWCRVYEVGGQKYFIKTLAKKNRPIWRKVIDNNTFLVFFGLFMVYLGYTIGELIYMPEIVRYDEFGNFARGNGDSIFVSLILVFLSVIGVGSIPEKKRTYFCSLYLPLIAAVGVSAYEILLSSYDIPKEAFEAVQVSKRWIFIALLQILWIPVWRINHDRITEKRPQWEDMYRTHNNVK